MDNYSLEKFFNDPVKNPFSYNLTLKNNNFSELFEELKKIFLTGLLYKTENKYIETDSGTSISLDKVDDNEIEKVKSYMLSIGIELVHKKYDLDDKDFYIKQLLYKIQDLKNINIKITSDWATQHIDKVSLGVEKEQLNELNTILKQYPESNYFLNLYQPVNMKDYRIQFVRPTEKDITNIIYFQPAKITDHHYNHHYMDNFDKHVR